MFILILQCCWALNFLSFFVITFFYWLSAATDDRNVWLKPLSSLGGWNAELCCCLQSLMYVDYLCRGVAQSLSCHSHELSTTDSLHKSGQQHQHWTRFLHCSRLVQCVWELKDVHLSHIFAQPDDVFFSKAETCTRLSKKHMLCFNIKLFVYSCISGAGTFSRYGGWLMAGRSKNWIPRKARFSAPAKTGPGAHPASYRLDTVFLSPG